METININCPECGLSIDYWTARNYFECPKCKYKIEVEPCKVEENLDITENEDD